MDRRASQFLYSPHMVPTIIDVNFTVAHTNANGKGISTLDGPGILEVYMNTNQTVVAGAPTVAAGNIVLKLTDNYNSFLAFQSTINAPNSGSSILVASAGTTAGTTYVITIVGTTTAAGWQSLGLPVGITPSVGCVFVATSTATATGTGAVQVPKSTGSGINHIELTGSPNTQIQPSGYINAGSTYTQYPSAGLAGGGSIFYFRTFLGSTITQPADGTVLGLRLYLEQSNVKTGQGLWGV